VPANAFFAPESTRTIGRWARSQLLTPLEPARLELTAVHREGRLLHLEAQAAVLRDGGVPIGTELVCRDITSRKELERLRADFLAMMGHDIRNPLGAIFGYTEMLLDPTHPLSPEHRDLLQRINCNTQTVLTLIGNFLETSKIEAGQMSIRPASLDVNALVQRTVEQYVAHAQLMEVTLTVAPALDLPSIAADPIQIERVIANLLTNAIKFTPRGGRVTVSTERLPSSVAVAVADTGVGIAPYEFSRIFQRYTRTGDTSREGTGLGLYIVGTLVEAHGGFMTVDSAPGAGTRFTAYLPITDWRIPAIGERPMVHPATATVH
jgi:signal transduction histidine kinase